MSAETKDTTTTKVAATTAEPAAASAPVEEAGSRLEAELREWKDKALRAQAECQNVARRLTEEKQQAIRLAGAGLARDLLNVVDNVERLMAAVKDHPADDPLVAGARLVADSFAKTLRDHHIERIAAGPGTPFDPYLHEALLHQPSGEVAEGHIVSELTAGYRMHDRVLRPARVAVARKPDEPAGAPSGS